MSVPASSQQFRSTAAAPGLAGIVESATAIQDHPILERARRAAEEHRGYAGNVTPREAHELASAGLARIIDVRTPEERKFVGYIPDSIPVAWMTGTAFLRNPRFVRELEGKARKDEVLLFVCRSGQRSAAAAEAATRANFKNAFNVTEGFEGELDEHRQRGAKGGWRSHALPWVQD